MSEARHHADHADEVAGKRWLRNKLKRMQMVVKPKNCCFCGELRTGTLIFSYLTLVRDIIVTLVSTTILFLSGSRIILLTDVGITVFCIVIGIISTNVIFTIVLIIGVHQFKNQHLKAYLIFNVVLMTIVVLLILILCIASESRVFILSGLIFLTFHMYYLLVITSFYLKMEAISKMSIIYPTIEDPPTVC